jgi:hypothetical protein
LYVGHLNNSSLKALYAVYGRPNLDTELRRNGSIRTVPVKYSSGPLAEGCVPFLFNSMMNLRVIAILLWSSRAVAINSCSTYLDITQHRKEQILASHCRSLVTEGCVIPAKTEPSFWDKNGGGRSAGNESMKP